MGKRDARHIADALEQARHQPQPPIGMRQRDRELDVAGAGRKSGQTVSFVRHNDPAATYTRLQPTLRRDVLWRDSIGMKPAYTRAALGAVLALSMLGVVPGVAFAAAPSCGDTLMSNTTLHADLDCSGIGNGTALYFGKMGLTLNLNGYTIWGPTGADYSTGVDTNEHKYDTVKNGTIANFETQVYANYSRGGTFKNLHLIGEYPVDTGSTGVYLYYGTDNVLSGSTLTDNYYGIYAYGSAGNWVSNNVFDGGSYGVYDEYENGDHYTGNTFKGYDYAGVYEDYSGNQVFTSNTANGNAGSGSYGFYFDCDDYGYVDLYNNVAKYNSSYGFYTYYCYDDDNAAGGNATWKGNNANHNGIGWYDEESLYAVVTGNKANNNVDEGFYLYDSGHMVFNNNTANHNGDDGIYIYDNYSPYYSPASVNNNTAWYNDGYGIDADYGIPGAHGNSARRNANAPTQCWNIDCNN